MNSRGTRIVLIVLGVIALVTGAVWVGQGLGYLPGSFMTGNKTWFTIGLFAAVIGIVLIVLGLRRKRRAR